MERAFLVPFNSTTESSAPAASGGFNITDLNTLLPAGSGWVLPNAWGITNSGLIIGGGTKNGSAASFLPYPARGSN
jgi:hypothetical protein